MSKSWSKKFLSLFRFSDLYKQKFNIHIGDSVENSTFFSIIVSIIVVTPLLIYFLMITAKTFNRTQVNINVQEYDVNERPTLVLTKSNFRFAFRIILGNRSSFSGDIEEYFDFEIGFRNVSQKNGQFTFNRVNYLLSACKAEDYLDFPKYYDLNLKYAFCMAPANNSTTMEIGGYWDEEKTGMFDFRMHFCNTTQNKSKCKDRNIIEQEMKESYFYVYIESQDVDGTNYEKPLKKSLKTFFQLLDFTTRKEILFYMQKVELHTFDSLIYNINSNDQNFYRQINVLSDSLTLNSVKDTMLIRMQILASNKVQIIERTYLTLIEAAAIVGGISSFLLVFGAVIASNYNEMRLKVKLINKLYSFNLQSNLKNQEKVKLFVPQIQKNIFKEILEDKAQILKKSQRVESENQIDIPEENILMSKKSDDNNLANFKEGKAIINNLFISDKQNPQNDDNKHKNKFISADFKQNTKGNLPIKSEIEILSISNTSKFRKILQKKEIDQLSDRIKNNEGKQIDHKNNKNNDNNDDDEKSSLQEKEEETKLKFSTMEIVRCTIFPLYLRKDLKSKFLLYKRASKYLLKYIDIFYLIKKLEDIEKLKILLLNDHQLALFQYISKPDISLEESKINDENNFMRKLEQLFPSSKSNEDLLPEIKCYYKNLIRRGNWSLTDVRLFDFLNENIKKYLKNS